MSIAARGVVKSFGSTPILRGVDLQVADGELVALLGPSGSGKTTLLRTVAGLERPDEGTVLIDGEDATHRAPAERRVGFVFQHYALFRHMTVFENVAFGLRVRPRAERPAEKEIRTRVHRLLELVQLDAFASRLPAQLSGGQRQRVSLARALAVEPRVLLLDEPFGALDAQVRRDLRRWLRDLHRQMKFTSVFVTHDQDEALELADRVVVMNAGRVEQAGSPWELYDAPNSRFVLEFLGTVNRFRGRVEGGRAVAQGLTLAPEPGLPEGTRVVACVRPHDVGIAREPLAGAAEAIVRHVLRLGSIGRVVLRPVAGAGDVEVELAPARLRELSLREGERVWFELLSARLFPDPAPEGGDQRSFLDFVI